MNTSNDDLLSEKSNTKYKPNDKKKVSELFFQGTNNNFLRKAKKKFELILWFLNLGIKSLIVSNESTEYNNSTRKEHVWDNSYEAHLVLYMGVTIKPHR